MKSIRLMICSCCLALLHLYAIAQDSTKHTAAKQIDKPSAAADKLYGKKIQQQTLLNKNIDTLRPVVKPAKQKSVKRRRANPS